VSSAEAVSEVTVPRQPAGTFLRLYDCCRPHGDALLVLSVQVGAPGLSASIGIETLEGDGLAQFVRELDDDFRGWAGERTWTSFRGDLQLRAIHTGRAVLLAWTLRFPEPAESDPGAWEATVRVQISPGEDLKALSSDLHAFLE